MRLNSFKRVLVILVTFILLGVDETTAQPIPEWYLSWSPDGTMLAVAGGTEVEIVDAQSGQILNAFTDLAQQATAPAWSGDGYELAIATEDRMEIWSTPWSSNTQLEAIFVNPRGSIYDLDWDTATNKIVLGGPPIRVWDRLTEKINYNITDPHGFIIEHLAWSEDGSYIVSGSVNGRIRTWDAHTGAALANIDTITSLNRPIREITVPVVSIGWSPTNDAIVFGGEDGTIRVLGDIAVPNIETRFATEVDPGVWRAHEIGTQVWSVDWSSTGEFIASSGYDRTIQIWDVNLGERVEIIQVDSATQVAWSPDGQTLAYVDEDGSLAFVPAPSQTTPSEP